MRLNNRFNEWIDHLSGAERITLLLCYVILVFACPLVVAIYSAYPDPEALARNGRIITLVEAVLLFIPLVSRWVWLKRHPLT